MVGVGKLIEEGQAIEVRIEDIDTEQKRISLTLVSEQAEDENGSESDAEDYKKYIDKSSSSASGHSKTIGTLGDILQAKLKEKEKK